MASGSLLKPRFWRFSIFGKIRFGDKGPERCARAGFPPLGSYWRNFGSGSLVWRRFGCFSIFRKKPFWRSTGSPGVLGSGQAPNNKIPRQFGLNVAIVALVQSTWVPIQRVNQMGKGQFLGVIRQEPLIQQDLSRRCTANLHGKTKHRYKRPSKVTLNPYKKPAKRSTFALLLN